VFCTRKVRRKKTKDFWFWTERKKEDGKEKTPELEILARNENAVCGKFPGSTFA